MLGLLRLFAGLLRLRFLLLPRFALLLGLLLRLFKLVLRLLIVAVFQRIGSLIQRFRRFRGWSAGVPAPRRAACLPPPGVPARAILLGVLHELFEVLRELLQRAGPLRALLRLRILFARALIRRLAQRVRRRLQRRLILRRRVLLLACLFFQCAACIAETDANASSGADVRLFEPIERLI